MSDEKTGYPAPPNPAYPPQQGGYPPQPAQPGGEAPPPYYHPPAQQYPPGVQPQQYPPGSQPQQYPPGSQPQQYPPGSQPQQYPPGSQPQQYPPGSQPQQYPPGSQPQQYPPVASPQQPGQTVIIRQTQVQPSDYLGFAIFVTICCCLPFGIVGIIKAVEVRSLFNSGEFQRAEDSSRSAKNWSCAGLVTGLIIIGAFFLFYLLLFVIFAASY